MVERELAGVRLLDLLARQWPDARRADLHQLLGAGEVSVNGVDCVSDRRLRLGDVVLLGSAPAPRRAAPVGEGGAASLEVLAETATALVVHKPAGVPTVPDRSGKDPGVHGQLVTLRPGDDLRIVHRLDRDTSGCLVLAKGLEAARHFDDRFRGGAVEKRYVALVEGAVAEDERLIDAWLGPDRRRPGRVVASDRERKGFRAARTRLAVRQRFARYTLVALRPETGRGHQLRVHLASIGHPIVCDSDYGGEALLLSRLKPDYKKRTGVDERPLLTRMFLHAERIAFEDVDGQRVAVEAPLPEDLALALRAVEKHQSRRRSQCD